MLACVLLTLLASAAATTASASAAQCTTTIKEPYAGCCEAPATQVFQSIDCHGCTLQVRPGPQCEIACSTTRTNPTSIHTQTVCKPTTIEPIETYAIVTSVEPIETYPPVTTSEPIETYAPATTVEPTETIVTFTTYVKPRAVTVHPAPPQETCTSTLFDINTGCCGPRPVQTAYVAVGCNGCVGLNVPAPQCDIDCSTTVTDSQFTSTRTVCAPATTTAYSA